MMALNDFHSDGFVPFSVRKPPISSKARGARKVWLQLRYDGVQGDVHGYYLGFDEVYIPGTDTATNPQFQFEKVTHWKPVSARQFAEYDN